VNGAVVDGLEQITDLDLVLNGTPLEVKGSGFRVQGSGLGVFSS